MAQRKISTPDLLLELLRLNAIKPEDALKYFANYKHFEVTRASIEQTHSGRWVASVNQEVYAEDSLDDLYSTIENLADANRAYIEQI